MDVKIKKWLDKDDVRSALHVNMNLTWQDADETGPVSVALKSDFMKSVMPQIEYLLDKDYKILM